MDTKRYNKIIDKFSNNLDSLKNDFEFVLKSQYADVNSSIKDYEFFDTMDRVKKIRLNVSKNMHNLNDLKVGLSKDCNFYYGFDSIDKEYNNFRKDLDSKLF